jgi:hypothetical protein
MDGEMTTRLPPVICVDVVVGVGGGAEIQHMPGLTLNPIDDNRNVNVVEIRVSKLLSVRLDIEKDRRVSMNMKTTT